MYNCVDFGAIRGCWFVYFVTKCRTPGERVRLCWKTTPLSPTHALVKSVVTGPRAVWLGSPVGSVSELCTDRLCSSFCVYPGEILNLACFALV